MSSDYHDFTRNLMQDIRKHGSPTSGPFEGKAIMVLTTKGAKSGQDRENVVMYSRDGKHYVVVASKSGAPTHPGWFHNLRTHPIVTVETGGQTFQARATVADEEERKRLYGRHADLHPQFKDYPKKTDRKIPVILLERLDGEKDDEKSA